MDTLLVTVDCLGESFDLGLPAEAPISEFLSLLVEACGQPLLERHAPADEWELAFYGGTALPITNSLQGCGVIAGMRLVLQNQGTQEHLVSRPVSGQVQVFPYLPDNMDAEGPRVHWIREDLFSE
ncbi:MAG TPA: EsaB/YukD family protein [Ktedonobacterales bacterium]|nr:EsaB/YukD family protein [Ktedonobacterales bacterium]